MQFARLVEAFKRSRLVAQGVEVALKLGEQEMPANGLGFRFEPVLEHRNHDGRIVRRCRPPIEVVAVVTAVATKRKAETCADSTTFRATGCRTAGASSPKSAGLNRRNTPRVPTAPPEMI